MIAFSERPNLNHCIIIPVAGQMAWVKKVFITGACFWFWAEQDAGVPRFARCPGGFVNFVEPCGHCRFFPIETSL
jgi:hypothetical protein